MKVHQLIESCDMITIHRVSTRNGSKCVEIYGGDEAYAAVVFMRTEGICYCTVNGKSYAATVGGSAKKSEL